MPVLAIAQSTTSSANTRTTTETTSEAQITRIDTSVVLVAGVPVVVDNPYGDVRLRFGGYEHGIDAHAVVQQPPGASVIAMQPAMVDGQYRIAPRLPEGSRLADGQRLDLVIFVAEGHPVIARTEQGLIESRGIRADISLNSISGDMAIRGTQGSIQARTGSGSIEASLGPAPAGSTQTLATGTGTIILAVDDTLDAHLEMSTSAAFATEFSLQVERIPGQEPNKKAIAVIGEDQATIIVESRRGEIRLLRWSEFTSTDGKPVDDRKVESDSD
ncbi:hypothetical protein [Dokdonella sp.]|uniref:hypothetical protein n=1 Tax=Dokdonella sp. TaxID=2291710 RepID=UPI00352780EE